MTDRFTNRVAAVTGAAGALGRAVAQNLAKEGAKLALFDRDPEGLAITAALCPGAITIAGDAASSDDVARGAKAAKDTFGPVE
ncbi:MAG: SDR family NAD(P)-dependent oxidoreductase, partial [Hyphomicrobiales bacterium]|nr:SDR family NAD(P)-dependent oxidoreductase [Hyphomicrobiales bacterium]